MVAINGRELLRHAVGTLRGHYNRCLTRIFRGRPTTLGPSSSFARTNLKKPFPRVAPGPPKRTWTQVAPKEPAPKGRKKGRVEQKRYNDLAKDNSTVFVPGGFRNEPTRKVPRRPKHDLLGGYELNSCEAANEDEAFVLTQLESLMFDKLKRESQFEAKEISERVKKHAPERKERMRNETTKAERLWMEELERRELKERADKLKDQRLAQLEKEKAVAEDGLAREKVDRKQSRIRRLFKEQQERHREGHLKQLRERETRLAAEREANLLRENAILEKQLRAMDNAFRRARDEREYMVQEKEEERARRLRAEESLHRWKELMKAHSPGGQQQQSQQPPSPEAQFELYEKKWEVLRSGVDNDGTKIHLIFFDQIPWPVVNMTPTNPRQIQPEHIREFLTHPLREKPDASGRKRTVKAKVRDELKRWHSDRFNPTVLSRVCEEDKLAVSEAAGMVVRVLTDMFSY